MQKSKFLFNIRLAVFPLFFGILFSCTHSPKPNPQVATKIQYVNFVDQLDSLRINGCKWHDIVRLSDQNPRFFDLWWSEVMGFNALNGEDTNIVAQKFQYWLNQNARVMVWAKSHYQKDSRYKEMLSNALSLLHGDLQAFNDTAVPQFMVYDYLSQFSNYSTFTDEYDPRLFIKKVANVAPAAARAAAPAKNPATATSAAASANKTSGNSAKPAAKPADKHSATEQANRLSPQKTVILAYSKELFFNDTFEPYSMMDLPPFFTRYCATNQIAFQLAMGYIKMKYEPLYKRNSMLEEAVFQGKLWYTTLQAFPGVKPYEVLGYSQEEWKWLEAQEGQIWKFFIDQKLLFATNFQDYKRFFAFGNKTFGGGVPDNCPPLIGNYLGYRIAEKWMKQNPDKKLKNLWDDTDANQILQQSEYNPVK